MRKLNEVALNMVSDMNPMNNMIFIKTVDKTVEIESCKYAKSKYYVKYFNAHRVYEYGYSSVRWLSKPKEHSVEKIQVCLNGILLSNVKRIVEFEGYFCVLFLSGISCSYPSDQIELNESCLDNGKTNNILDYFKTLSKYISLKTDDGISLMEKKYNKLNFVDNNTVLATYLDQNRFPIRKTDISEMIFPFGCNTSQKEAVTKALTNSISVIEGPPGTGKTQTILNIIANLILQNKTVAVVSNNNSATLNVVEKLKKYNLDFITAYLGNKQNKKDFIENQTQIPKYLKDIDVKNYNQVVSEASTVLIKINEMLALQNMMAQVKQEIDATILEEKHFGVYYDETHSEKHKFLLKRTITSKNLLRQLIKYDLLLESDNDIKSNIFDNLKIILSFGLKNYRFFSQSKEDIIPSLQRSYYMVKAKELQKEFDRLKNKMEQFDFDEKMEQLTNLSIQVFNTKLAMKYSGKTRHSFVIDDLWKNPRNIIADYPVILSTTYSITSSLKDITYDYIIVDEASQVDLLTGVQTLSCAKNIVVVGDRMQLPNVVDTSDTKSAFTIGKKFDVPEAYQYEKNSLLTSIISLLNNVPNTLLKEHYRCHPKIIQFCNQKFYRNKLVIMTEDHKEDDVLKVYKTVAGNHARGHVNQRQIDEIVMRVLPELGENIEMADVGIISPYRAQKSKLEDNLNDNNIEIDTVHKFQGREKNNIIITTVDNEISVFTDNPNMLNVAISRAKNKIRLIVSDNESNSNTNIAEFIRYISYNNFDVVDGEVYSIFDLLYKGYKEQRRILLEKKKRVSEFDSENLMYIVIEEVLKEDTFCDLDVAIRQSLNMLIRNPEKLSDEEVKYAMNMATHLDFLIYRMIDKSPVIAIEVDGQKYHKEGTKQYARDRLKDSIMKKYDIPLIRFNTTGSNEKALLKEKLMALYTK
jgi:superfamily I DNA and/or RNA helicase